MGLAPRLNLSDHDIALAGSLLTDFLRRFEQSIPAPAVFPALDQGVLAELLATPFPEEGIGVEQLFRCIIRGRFGLRACITNYRTEKRDIDLVLDRLRLLAS